MKQEETTKLGVRTEVSYQSSTSFSREGLGKKLAKLFKKELQTGDRAFDDAIYISTDTPETTAKLLADEQVRGTISLYVTTGGPIEIHGNKMCVTLLGRQNNEDPVVVALLRSVLAMAQP